jgi:hypothetical protein
VSAIPRGLRRLVTRRAHIDHIVPSFSSGRTAVGRATITALQLNQPRIIQIRREEVNFGRHP